MLEWNSLLFIDRNDLLWFVFEHFAEEFVGSDTEDENDSDDLSEGGLMMEIDEWESDSDDFSGGDDKGHDVLFELFDHSVDEDLSDKGEDGHGDEVDGEEGVVPAEVDGVPELADDNGV